MKKLSRRVVAATLLLNACGCTDTSDQPSPHGDATARGIVVESVGGWALEKAGMQTGDVLLSWKRLPSPPANPAAAEGRLSSYFDWLDLQVEQAPRGTMVLQGRRTKEAIKIRVEPGLWKAKVRPVLSPAFEQIYATGMAHLDTGEFEAAIKAWGALADGASADGNGDLQAWITMRMAEVWKDQGELEKAFGLFEQALDASESPSAKIVAWEALGKAHESRHEFETVRSAYVSALELRSKHCPESLGIAIGLTNLGSLAWARWDLELSRDYILQALGIHKRHAPQSLEMASSLNALGIIAWARGDLNVARSHLQQALHIYERLAPRSLPMSVSLSGLGSVAQARGDLDLAYEYYNQALQISRKIAPQSLDLAAHLQSLGSVALLRGDLDLAHDYFFRSLRIYEQIAPQSLDVAANLNNLGLIAQQRGQLDRAFDYHLQSLQIREEIAPESLKVATSLGNLGSVAWARGDLDLSQEYYLRALRFRERLAADTLDLATSLHNLAEVALARDELDLARNYALQALRIKKKLAPRSLTVAASLATLAKVATSRGQRDSALDYYHQVLRIREQLAPGTVKVAETLKRLGDMAQVLGDLAHAFEWYKEALETLERQISRLGGSYNVQAGFRAKYGDYYRDTMDLLLRQDRFAEAFHVLERLRAKTFLTMLTERDITFAADIPEELDRERRRFAVRYDRTLKTLAKLNLRDHSEKIEATRRQLEKLQDEYGDLEARIRRVSSRLAALQYPKALAVAGTRRALDPGTLLISFSVGKDRTTVFVLSRVGDLEVKILPMAEEALRTKVQDLLRLSRERPSGSYIGERRRQRFEDASRQLYAALLEPAAERIAANDRLLILPDGPLHALPFTALLRGGTVSEIGGQYLVEWKPLHVAVSATVYAELKQRRHAGPGASTRQDQMQLVAFGDPHYPEGLLSATEEESADANGLRGDAAIRSATDRGIFDWQSLPHTRREVESIASLFPDEATRTFLGSEALEERVKSLDPKTSILHLATHGYADKHLPTSSFIALTIPEEAVLKNPEVGRDNGLLQVWEIFERVRIDADLVVLSACESGLGQELGSEGLIGLTRAFQYAGARSVAASLWSVADQATAELMIRFYHHLRSGLPKDEALRAAQLEFIRKPIEVTGAHGNKVPKDVSAPYYWAAFQIYGDWQ